MACTILPATALHVFFFSPTKHKPRVTPISGLLAEWLGRPPLSAGVRTAVASVGLLKLAQNWFCLGWNLLKQWKLPEVVVSWSKASWSRHHDLSVGHGDGGPCSWRRVSKRLWRIRSSKTKKRTLRWQLPAPVMQTWVSVSADQAATWATADHICSFEASKCNHKDLTWS